ncbi:uncharacterized protein LOC131176342 isoform X2 [Hevea brasiliensis]|uniref:uncharacterized protein LOC131176342 isoform X2 n=1 Tax=Hevea brasiliensis TaxID=3981 RepID=UPI0025E26BE5|nr:uncharacterized protein LOC131176342 isoform X2 [Hevea brasiliensis]
MNAPVGIRLWHYLQEEAGKGKGGVINPFFKRFVTSCQGIPLGGIGSITLGRLLQMSPCFLHGRQWRKRFNNCIRLSQC